MSGFGICTWKQNPNLEENGDWIGIVLDRRIVYNNKEKGGEKCRKIMIILDNPGLQVESVHSQYEIQNLQGHSVRLDVYAVDAEGKKYDIEIQRSDKGASPKRARYNSSAVDVRGAEYDQLTENYVIFITQRDELGADLPIYHIDRTIRETTLEEVKALAEEMLASTAV